MGGEACTRESEGRAFRGNDEGWNDARGEDGSDVLRKRAGATAIAGPQRGPQ